MSDLPSLLAVFSVAAGVSVVANTGKDFIQQYWSARAEARKLAKELESEALQSNDITKLGEYLYNNIGATRISNYVNDNIVRERVKQALGGVLEFLGPEETKITPRETEEAEEAEESRQTLESRDNLALAASNEPMRKALEEIRFGEVWNGLARMRRYLEARLRAVIPDVPNKTRLSFGQLLDILTREGRLPAAAAKQLRYAFRVASAGIHGTDVDRGQAEEAWQMAAAVLAELAPPVSPDNDPAGEGEV